MNKQEVEMAIKQLKNDIDTVICVYKDTMLGKSKEHFIKCYETAINALTHQLTNGWIPVSERLPELPDGRSSMNLNATILSPSGLRNAVPLTWELKRGKPTWCYLGLKTDWNVIAWQPLPPEYKEVSDAERN